MSFRDNLLTLRAEKNMTQEQLAMLLGVSRQSVTKWEAERSYPEMDKLLKMCDIFDCSLDELVKGDLSGRVALAKKAIPAGLPADVCGYEDYQRMLAWKIPTGIALIMVGIALGFLFEGSVALSSWNGKDGLFILIVLVGILAGLVFLIPAGMAHSAFVKAHPFVEDFYTTEDKTRAQKNFTKGLLVGLVFIVMGIGCFLTLENTSENYALFFALLFSAVGVWSIVHFGMLMGRTNVDEYNKTIADELEIEDITKAQLDAETKEKLLNRRTQGKKLGALCGVIMIVATLVGFGLLLAPVFSSADPSNFEPEGTSAMWFWVAWPIGGLLCGVVALLWEAFGKKN